MLPRPSQATRGSDMVWLDIGGLEDWGCREVSERWRSTVI